MSSQPSQTPERATATKPRRIGWVGTGIMGSSMAGHLLRAGHAVTVHSRTKAKARHLLDAGAQWAETPAEAAQGADFVCTNVGLPSEVEAVHFGHDGVLSTVSEGQCLIDFSTSPPSLARRISEVAAAKGAAALDAPVSGGDVGARNATLSIMVGGDPAAFERAMPLFSAVGKAIVLQGPAGSGQRTKIVNQVLVAASTLGMCEAMHYAQVAGLDPQRVLDAVSGGAAASWALSNLAPRILRGDFEPGFMVEHLVKDLRIARDEAQELGEVLPLVDLCLSRYEQLAVSGHPRKGTQGLYLLYRDRLGKA